MKFIVALREHYNLGYLLVPYLVEKTKSKFYYTIYKQLSLDAKQLDYNFSKTEIALLRTIGRYSDTELVRVFSRNKSITFNDFLQQQNKETIAKRIRPYIERHLFKCIELLANNPTIPVFFKSGMVQHIYFDDEIKVQAEPAQTVFNFIKKSAESKYFLSIKHNGTEMNLTDTNGTILCNEPCALLLNQNLYMFNDIDGKKLQPFFTKSHITIPKTVEKKYFSTFVKKAIANYQVNAEGFEIKHISPKPKVILSLEKDWKEELAFILKFVYNENTFLKNSPTDTVVSFFEDNGAFRFERFQRRMDFEEQCQAKLLKQGLIKVNDGLLKTSDKFDEPSRQKHATIEWLTEHSKWIEEQGFILEQNADKQTFFMQKIRLNLETRLKNDWFDIKGTVNFGDTELPFTALRENILFGKREFKLPTGEIAIIPEEWFSQYKHLVEFGTVTQRKSLQIPKAHFRLLPPLKTGIEKDYLNDLQEFNQMQQHFKATPPQGIKAELRQYQKIGYDWLYLLKKNNFGGCLADDMGLGKTLQTLALLQKVHKEEARKRKKKEKPQSNVIQLSLFEDITAQAVSDSETKTHLIVMPTSLIYNWSNEIRKFTPNLKILLYTGSQREKNIKQFKTYHIILSTYGIVRNDIEILRDFNFHYVILDESQNIKNPTSKTYLAVTQLQAQYRLVLTGTPIENSLIDLWAQMNFLNKGLLGNLPFFKSRFVLPIEKHNDEQRQQQLQQLIQPFILRRTKQAVLSDLPPLTEQTIYCEMTDKQRSLYETVKSKMRNLLLDFIETKRENETAIYILQALTKLRQLANHPSMTEENYAGGSGKFEQACQHIEALLSENHKVLIFSSFVKHLNLFKQFFVENGMEYSMLTGATANRKKVITDFQKNPQNRLFLISLKAGGVGLNLTAADYVFLLDPWWNPAVENQAVSRAHRIGQDRKVFVYRFISADSIEEKIERLKQRKTALANAFVESNNPFKTLSQNEIMALFA